MTLEQLIDLYGLEYVDYLEYLPEERDKMILSSKDKLNLIDTLIEWEACVGCKEMDEDDVGLDDDRFGDLMRRLGVKGVHFSTNIREKKEPKNES